MYEKTIKPQIESLESERDQLKAIVVELEDALRPFAEIYNKDKWSSVVVIEGNEQFKKASEVLYGK